VKKLIDELNRKLYQGWNPFIELDSPRGLTEISKVCERFIQMKEKELRADSMRSYNSFLKTFQEWIEKRKKSLVYIGTFKKIDALDFFDYLYSEKNISNKTYNNYRTFFATFFNWLRENKYIHENPFTDFKKKIKKLARPVYKCHVDGCAHGLRSLGGDKHLRKRWTNLTTDEVMAWH
jgi:integrase